jgi:isoleucyl-tRNA synthetase
MKFKQGSRRKPIEYEKDLIGYWKKHQTFEKSVEQRPATDAYVFYDGPPFITGVPHHGTLLSSIVKDAVPRYFTMKGKRIERRWGWDCHGLPAEVFTETKLGIKDKRDIGTKVSLEDYINFCRTNMVQTGNEWESTIERIGRWVDFKGAYKTMDKDYMESVWWAFQKLYEAGKIYEGEKVLLYCIRDATPISKAEVAMDNSYQDDTDPSVYVKFKLTDDDAYLLVWTTTPWTLHSNTAIAVNNDLEYVEIEVAGERFILAKALVETVLTDERHQPIAYTVLRTFRGKELVGKRYEPLFQDRGPQAHQVWHADFVHDEEGTGIAHESPAYGEEDYELSKQMGFPMVLDTDDEGYYTSGEWEGRQIWEVNKEIAKTLHERGVIWKIVYITHSYPHCHRCGTKLMYRAHPSWFMDIEGQRERMLELNSEINWFPKHIKNGRFAKTVESAPDWNISRDRFWATAMPVWKGTDEKGTEHVKVIGSYAELKELSNKELDDYHRPWVDDVTFTIDNVEYTRIDKVLDCWFESGSMPFAQFHYPFENSEKFEQNFPGDFVSEYVGQVRAWFYYLHAVGVGLFDSEAFKNVIVTGTLLGADGRKLSKHLNNFTDPNILMDQYSADSLRFLLLSSPALTGEDFIVTDKEVGDVARKLNMIWNMYDFFTLYADVDGWEWNGLLEDPSAELTNPLDQWVVARIHQLTGEVDTHMQAYDIPNALKPVLEFIDDASNWYVRRSRKRFWKSQNDNDKSQAYQTLHYILIQLAIVLAPFTPFLSEELYHKLTGGESVHLLDWPKVGHVDELAVRHMTLLRHAINVGLSLRAEQGIKVRQPLASVRLKKDYKELLNLELLEILKEELNVKEVVFDVQETLPEKTFGGNIDEHGLPQVADVVLDTTLTPELQAEGDMRELVRFIQNARKEAGLKVSDRIRLGIESPDKQLMDVVNNFKNTITQETLALSLGTVAQPSYETTAKVNARSVVIKISKA